MLTSTARRLRAVERALELRWQRPQRLLHHVDRTREIDAGRADVELPQKQRVCGTREPCANLTSGGDGDVVEANDFADAGALWRDALHCCNAPALAAASLGAPETTPAVDGAGNGERFVAGQRRVCREVDRRRARRRTAVSAQTRSASVAATQRDLMRR